MTVWKPGPSAWTPLPSSGFSGICVYLRIWPNQQLLLCEGKPLCLRERRKFCKCMSPDFLLPYMAYSCEGKLHTVRYPGSSKQNLFLFVPGKHFSTFSDSQKKTNANSAPGPSEKQQNVKQIKFPSCSHCLQTVLYKKVCCHQEDFSAFAVSTRYSGSQECVLGISVLDQTSYPSSPVSCL